MDGLAQVNLIVTDFERAKEFWALLGWPPTPRHPSAALVAFPNGMNLVLHEPDSPGCGIRRTPGRWPARQWWT